MRARGAAYILCSTEGRICQTGWIAETPIRQTGRYIIFHYFSHSLIHFFNKLISILYGLVYYILIFSQLHLKTLQKQLKYYYYLRKFISIHFRYFFPRQKHEKFTLDLKDIFTQSNLRIQYNHYNCTIFIKHKHIIYVM